MKTSSLERLEKTKLPHDQALAILQAVEAEFADRDGALASKADLRTEAGTLRSEILAAKNDLQGEIRGTEHRLELKLEALRTELKCDIQGAIRWNFLFWVTQLAAVASILKFVR